VPETTPWYLMQLPGGSRAHWGDTASAHVGLHAAMDARARRPRVLLGSLSVLLLVIVLKALPLLLPLPLLHVRVLPARGVLDLDVHENGARPVRPRESWHQPVSQLPQRLLLLFHLYQGFPRAPHAFPDRPIVRVWRGRGCGANGRAPLVPPRDVFSYAASSPSSLTTVLP
jgi:hypothetical protein